MTEARSHRLDGLEPDNLLAFLALLGLLRALEASDGTLHPRVAWDLDRPPLRPRVHLSRELTPELVADCAADGIETLASDHDFAGRKDLNYTRAECRELLKREALAARLNRRRRADLIAALMSDAALKDDKQEIIDPTALCLLLRQGHQHFLERLAGLPHEPSPPPRGRGRSAQRLSAAECLGEALFQPWHRSDATFSFRWDPDEDVRHALMGGDPTDAAYKRGTQHGANRLAAVGLGVVTLVPQIRAGRVRPGTVGGAYGVGGFSFAWPIWREPTTIAAIRAMLAHQDLRKSGGLSHLGVEHVMVAQRISVGNYINFSRAKPLPQDPSPNAR